MGVYALLNWEGPGGGRSGLLNFEDGPGKCQDGDEEEVGEVAVELMADPADVLENDKTRNQESKRQGYSGSNTVTKEERQVIGAPSLAAVRWDAATKKEDEKCHRVWRADPPPTGTCFCC